MHALFSTNKNNLFDFVRTLSTHDVRDCCSSKIYERGQDYFESDCISDAVFNREKTQLKTTVEGSEDYTVVIELSNGRVYGSCTCPYEYEDVCKHQIATLLYAASDEAEFGFEKNVTDTNHHLHPYLQSLSKNELVSLVEKYAPERFRTEVNNKYANSSESQKIFHKVEQKIRKYFNDDDLMYHHNDFSDTIDKELAKLVGLEKPLHEEIESLLFYVIQEVERAFDNGYLYDDYNDDFYETSQNFDEFVARYVACLKSSEKTAFLAKLDAVLNNQSYSTFEGLREIAGSVFSDNDLPHLKNVLMTGYKNISHELAGKYYDKVLHLLSFNEKISILGVLMQTDNKRAIELATLYNDHGDVQKAVETLKRWLAANQETYYHNENVYSFYLELLQKKDDDLSDAAKDAIIHCPTNTMLTKIVSVINGAPNRYEQLLEQKNAGELLRYLEKEMRLPEALALIKRKDNIPENLIYRFFKTHKMVFPNDAITYFTKIIDINLQGVGNRFYEAIVDAIRQLTKVNREQADEYLNHIRVNYKRRRNLIVLLNDL